MRNLLALSMTVIILTGCKTSPDETSRIHVYQDTDSKEIGISYGNNLLTLFHYSGKEYKPCFFPVNSVSGIRLNRGWPEDPNPWEPLDHPHQKGIWFSFGDVNGLDFWNNSDSIPRDQKCKYGRILCDTVVIQYVDSADLKFYCKNLWISCKNELLLREFSGFRISANDSSWFIDRTTSLEADIPLNLGDNKEGLWGMRVTRELQSDYGKKQYLIDSLFQYTRKRITHDEGKSGNYTGSNGHSGPDVWGTVNEWVILDGVIGSDSVTVMIMDHPGNPNHPPMWHARDYGLFAVNNLGRSSFNPGMEGVSLSLGKGEKIVFHHRILFYEGGFLSATKAKMLFEDFLQSVPYVNQ